MNSFLRINIGKNKRDINEQFILSNGFIGDFVCQNILEILKSQKRKLVTLSLVFFDKVEKIDILFISYLIMFKTKYSIENIILKVPNLERNVQQTLYQYLFFGSVTYKNTLFYIDETLSEEISFKNKEYPFSLGYFVVSTKFSPILLINSIENLIQLSTVKLEKLFKESPNSINNNLDFVNDSCLDKNQRYNFKNYDVAFKNLIKWYYKTFENKVFNIANFTKSKNITQRDFNEFKSIPIEKLSIIEFIIFYQLVNSFLESEQKYKIEDGLKIKKLYSDSFEIAKGIIELLKNSIQHSGSNYGILTIRTFKRNEWLELNQFENRTSPIEFKEYITSIISATPVNKFIDINVIDGGEMGILPTFSKNYLNTDNKNYPEDIKIQFSTVDLFSIIKGIPLLYQAKRANAHLGLLIYNNKINSLQGLISVFSKNENFENCIVYKNYSQVNLLENNYFGSRIETIIPIIEVSIIREDIKEIFNTPIDNSVHFGNIEKILDYNLVHYSANMNQNKNDIPYINVDSKYFLGNELFKNLPEIPRNYKNMVLIFSENSIDDMDESELFRFLGEWEIKYPRINLSMVNIPIEKVHNLYNLNNKFSEVYKELPYWNKNRITSFYSYYLDDQYNRKFFFTDYFWGDSFNDFHAINYYNSQTNFSSLMIDNKFQNIGDKFIENKIKNILPLELIIIVDGKTIFEYNTEYLLQKEI